jgi:hypothetical protein
LSSAITSFTLPTQNGYISNGVNNASPSAKCHGLGMRYTFIKNYAPTGGLWNSITINAPTNQKIRTNSGDVTSYTFSASESYVTFVCVDWKDTTQPTGWVSWVLINRDINGNYMDLTTNQSISGTKTFSSISIPNGYVDLVNTQSIYGVKNFYGSVNVYNNFSTSGNVNLTGDTLNFNTTSGTNCNWNVGPLLSSASTFPNMGVTGGPTSYQIVYCSSSRNTKQNIITITENDPMYNTNNFMKLRPIFYNPKEGCGNTSNRYIGFIAEEINDLGFEELVQFNGDAKEKIMGISYDRITVYLVKTIQEQQKKIDELNDKLNSVMEILKSKGII